MPILLRHPIFGGDARGMFAMKMHVVWAAAALVVVMAALLHG